MEEHYKLALAIMDFMIMDKHAWHAIAPVKLVT